MVGKPVQILYDGCAGADLKGADLSYADLTFANLKGAKLTGVINDQPVNRVGERALAHAARAPLVYE